MFTRKISFSARIRIYGVRSRKLAFFLSLSMLYKVSKERKNLSNHINQVGHKKLAFQMTSEQWLKAITGFDPLWLGIRNIWSYSPRDRF